MYSIILIAILIGIILSISLQTSINIFFRSIGLVIVSLSILVNYSSNLNKNSISIIAFGISLSIIGFLLDYYSASLRTWFFMVSEKSITYNSYITFITAFLISYIFNPGIANSIMIGSIFGAIIAEFISQGKNKNIKNLLKYSLGSLIGLYGLSIKVLFSLQIAEVFVRNF